MRHFTLPSDYNFQTFMLFQTEGFGFNLSRGFCQSVSFASLLAESILIINYFSLHPFSGPLGFFNAILGIKKMNACVNFAIYRLEKNVSLFVKQKNVLIVPWFTPYYGLKTVILDHYLVLRSSLNV